MPASLAPRKGMGGAHVEGRGAKDVLAGSVALRRRSVRDAIANVSS